MTRQVRSAGFVIFHQTRQSAQIEREFLLLDYGKHWDFPKGHVEAGEDDLSTALRELREETGIDDPRVLTGFRREMMYFYRNRQHELVRKTVVFFLASMSGKAVTISHEHTGYAFLPYAAALERLTFPNARELLQAAHDWLKTQENSGSR